LEVAGWLLAGCCLVVGWLLAGCWLVVLTYSRLPMRGFN